MNQQLRTALLTTLKQLPMIGLQWLFLAMALPQRQGLPDGVGMWVGGSILLIMLGMTFWVAYKTERINQRPLLIYHMIWVIPVMVIALDMLWVAHVGVFLLSLYLYARPLKHHPQVDKPMADTEDLEGVYVKCAWVHEGENMADTEDLEGVYVHPNWFKIKKEQFDDVDISHNTASQITALSCDEFYEFLAAVDESLYVTYVSTLNPEELQKFYDDLPKFCKPESVEDLRKHFAEAIQAAKEQGVTDADKARATLEMPLYIQEAKFRVWVVHFIPEEFDAVTYHDDDFNESEQELNHIIVEPFGDVAIDLVDYFSRFKNTYQDNDAFRGFAYHLADRVGGLCLAIEKVFFEEQNTLEPLVWFRESFVENRKPDPDAVPWKVTQFSPDNFLVKLVAHQTAAFEAVAAKDTNAYLLERIHMLRIHLELFPMNKQQVYEGLQEIMQFVGEKDIDAACADAFIEMMRDDIPAIYWRLSYGFLMELKERINLWIAKYKPHENTRISPSASVLTNYLLDLEDLLLETEKQSVQAKLERRYTMPLAEYIKLFEPFKSAEDLARAGLWNHAVIIDQSWTKFDGIIRNKQGSFIGWDESTVTSDIFDMTQEIPVWFEKKDGECLSVGIPHALVSLKTIDNDHLRLAPQGMFRLMGYDTYDYGEHFIADFESLDEAISGMQFQLSILKKENEIRLFLYDDEGKCLKDAEVEEKREKQISNLNSFEDLLKRGNLPDDDREVPNWLKIKNRQFDDVDVSHNTVDDMFTLTSPEFIEFVAAADEGLLLTYLNTLSESELSRFYQYCDDVVRLKSESDEEISAKAQFQALMQKADQLTNTHESIARATLEIPLLVNFAKYSNKQFHDFSAYVAQDYYNYDAADDFKMYEGHLVKTIWGEMKYIPNHFEQVLDHFCKFYDENNEAHQKFFAHLANRFGKLIAILNNLVVKTEERNTSLNWFTGKMVEHDLIGDFQISISQSQAMTTDQKLINFLSTTFLGICDEHEDNYLTSLICVVETMFEWYPVNQEACEYAMVEMMKSVAVKKVSVENANRFLDFFAELPRFYAVLNYDRIYELKELIAYTLATEKPLDNKVFDEDDVQNKLVLLNYLIDVEDLYYQSGKTDEESM